MIFLKKKDIKNRKLYKKKEINLKIKKFLFIHLLNNTEFNYLEKTKFLYLFLKKQSENKTKIVLRCIITNRSRGVYRPFNISRLMLRELIHSGVIPGYIKSVW